jgi:hypothetical protein
VKKEKTAADLRREEVQAQAAKWNRQERIDQTARLYFALRMALPMTGSQDPKEEARKAYKTAQVLEDHRAQQEDK